MECTHLDQITPEVTSDQPGVCKECIALHDDWVHLRMCLTCGHVGCCDSSKNTHAIKHFQETGHAIMQSAQPGEDWKWCYIDQIYLAERPEAS